MPGCCSLNPEANNPQAEETLKKHTAEWELREEIAQLQAERAELISLNLWSARRLHKVHKSFAYDELEEIIREKVERL